jgi:hypothetical protein
LLQPAKFPQGYRPFSERIGRKDQYC